jgi:hypothetical protein
MALPRNLGTPNAEEIRLRGKLQEQLRFVQRSSGAFDQGTEEEAIRIATALRIIFHDAGRSVSLLAHLGLQDGRMLSSSRGHGDFKDYLSVRLDLSSRTPTVMAPMLGGTFTKVSVNQWWKHEPVFVHAGQQYPRRKIVLSVANKDGGAHVDKELEEYYEVLCAGEYAIGITGDLQYSGPPPFQQGVTHFPKNAHLALIRQFAHETLASAKHFSWPTEVS